MSASQEDNTVTVPSGQTSQIKRREKQASSSSGSYSGSGSSSSGSSSGSDSSSTSNGPPHTSAPFKQLLPLEPPVHNLVDGVYDSEVSSQGSVETGAASSAKHKPIIPDIHPEATRIPPSMSGSGIQTVFTDDQRFRDYDPHTSIADKPYIGFQPPGYLKPIRVIHKVSQYNSFAYPLGYSHLMDKAVEILGIDSPVYENIEGERYPVLPPSSLLMSVYEDLNGQLRASTAPRRDKFPPPPTFLYRIRTDDQPGKFANSTNMADRVVSTVPDQFTGLIVPDAKGQVDLTSTGFVALPANQLSAMELSAKHVQDQIYHTQVFTTVVNSQLELVRQRCEDLVARFPDASITIPEVKSSIQPLILAEQALQEITALHEPMLRHSAFVQGSMEMARRHNFMYSHNLIPCMQEEDKVELVNSPLGSKNLFSPDSCIAAQHAALATMGTGYFMHKTKPATTHSGVTDEEDMFENKA